MVMDVGKEVDMPASNDIYEDERRQKPPGRRVALVAGVNHAPEEPNLSRLKYAESSVLGLSDVFKTTYCDFELYTPPLLGQEATTQAVRDALLDAIDELGPDDLLVFYFCGHGSPVSIKAEELDVYLVTHDFKEKHL
ncbi:MAG: caspase family protein, partial [Chloroflexales bacterium]|nr:caspase family protein [Chloroflexales bacterium]